MIKPTDLIPTKYRIPPPNKSALYPLNSVTIEERIQPDGKSLWSVNQSGNVMGMDGEWELEPMPSNRDEEFYRRCRFNSIEEALKVLNRQL